MPKFITKMRLLPITIFAACLMLTFKISDIVGGIGGPHPGLPVSSAAAQQPPAPPPAANQAPPPAADQAPGPGVPEVPGEAPGARPAAAPPGAEPPPPAEETALDDPSLFTQNEIDLLQQLADRREALEARMRELETREVLLTAAEKQPQ